MNVPTLFQGLGSGVKVDTGDIKVPCLGGMGQSGLDQILLAAGAWKGDRGSGDAKGSGTLNS